MNGDDEPPISTMAWAVQDADGGRRPGRVSVGGSTRIAVHDVQVYGDAVVHRIRTRRHRANEAADRQVVVVAVAAVEEDGQLGEPVGDPGAAYVMFATWPGMYDQRSTCRPALERATRCRRIRGSYAGPGAPGAGTPTKMPRSVPAVLAAWRGPPAGPGSTSAGVDIRCQAVAPGVVYAFDLVETGRWRCARAGTVSGFFSLPGAASSSSDSLFAAWPTPSLRVWAVRLGASRCWLRCCRAAASAVVAMTLARRGDLPPSPTRVKPDETCASWARLGRYGG